MSPYQSEELENIRRVAERLKAYAEFSLMQTMPHNASYILNVCIHIIDTVARIKKNDVNASTNS